MVSTTRRVLLVSGGTRGGSTNTAVLRTAQAAAAHGVVAELYGGLTTASAVLTALP